MIEVIPVMLFMLGWHPSEPGQIDLQRIEVIFTSMEECETAGAKLAEKMTKAAADKSGASYEHRCINIPPAEEFETAFNPDGSPAK
uniref:hypothetical protein n=1 Tax=uncultured Erythrobacter sp. TaxID=263913 RepID=UPI002604E930|nr:hypothetical protein [uncultured Erythrobacter sp.]